MFESEYYSYQEKRLKISDHIIQFNEGEEFKRLLTSKSFPVNTKRLKTIKEYRESIFAIIKYMDVHLRSNFSDYREPKGVSAVELGFPLTIISVKIPASVGDIQHYINPVITSSSLETSTVQTTSGTSPQNNRTVTAIRKIWITFDYYDLKGDLQKVEKMTRNEGGFVVQHEIEQIEGKNAFNL